uniref:IRF tryptophan pentad repeat domain-containing protein n=1 Tax=Ciona savignyi TaxID=51511 RepID=H2ZQ83_CIOSA
MSAEDQEFKLPLRNWLIKKIEQKEFDGLLWIDEDQKIFKIPWTQKKYPNWEKHCEIFVAWARHRGSYDESSKTDYKKLKGNFRCALNKSDDFEEIRERSVTNQQTGNYKIYRILNKQEVREKRAKRKHSANGRAHGNSRSQSKQQKSEHTTETSHWPSSDFKAKHSKQQYQQELQDKVNSEIMRHSTMPLEQMQIVFQADQHFEADFLFDEKRTPLPFKITGPITDIAFCDFPSSSNLATLSPFIQPINTMMTSNDAILTRNCQYEENMMSLDSSLSPNPSILASPEGISIDQLQQPIMLIEQQQCVELADQQSPTNSSQSMASFENFLRGFNLSCQDLNEYNVILEYNGQPVKEDTLSLANGVRFMYGLSNLQRDMVKLYRSDNERKLFEYTPWPFPDHEISEKSKNITSILTKTDLGVVLHAKKFGLTANRICQSQIFYFDPHTPSDAPIKLERQSVVELFSYSKYIRALFDHRHNQRTGSVPESVVKLIIGTKPSSVRSHGLVSLTIRPTCASILEKQLLVSDSSSILAMSNETSLDQVARMLDGWQCNPPNNVMA